MYKENEGGMIDMMALSTWISEKFTAFIMYFVDNPLVLLAIIATLITMIVLKIVSQKRVAKVYDKERKYYDRGFK